jgi:hypothetical protein
MKLVDLTELEASERVPLEEESSPDLYDSVPLRK